MATQLVSTGVTFPDATTQTTAVTSYVSSLTAGTNISLSASTGAVTISASSGAPSTAQVLSATAGANAGDVGSYAFLYSGSAVSTGSNYAGSSLFYSCYKYNTFNQTAAVATGTQPSGTWKCMGYGTVGTNLIVVTVFLRVA